MHFSEWATAEFDRKIGCTIQLSGTQFDPDTFLEESTVSQSQILFKGPFEISEAEARRFRTLKTPELPDLPTAEELLNLLERQNLLISVSEAHDSISQIADATAFLAKHQEELKNLRSARNVETAVLRFNTDPKLPSGGPELFTTKFLSLIAECEIVAIATGSQASPDR